MIWEPHEVGRFLDASRDHRLYALFHLIAFTGMRRGEAIGLHWTDVKLDTQLLIVQWQVTDSGDGPTFGAPKTDSGARIVPIDGITTEVLRQHRDRQLQERSRSGETWVEKDLVFTKENGDVLRPDAVTHLFADLVRRADVPKIRLHDLRHTHASLALAAGVDLKIVSDRLGHSTTAITADLYTHVTSNVARQAAEAIASKIPLLDQRNSRDVSEMLASNPFNTTGTDPPNDVSAGEQQSRQGDSNP